MTNDPEPQDAPEPVEGPTMKVTTTHTESFFDTPQEAIEDAEFARQLGMGDVMIYTLTTDGDWMAVDW